ncbi:MAG: YHS domain-containing (seleno)protein [Flavobacteriaceae bacterium]
MKKFYLLFAFLFSISIFGQKNNLDDSFLAVKGYDVVSYHTKGIPQKGKKAFEVNHNGARYLFLSKENKQRFLTHPSAYIPAYGGWCAYAMVKGKEVEINPKAFYIQQGKLYLFYKTPWVDTQAKWVKNKDALKIKADAAWAKKQTQEFNED